MMDACKYPEGGFRWERLSRDRQVGRFAALEAVGVAHLVAARPGPDVPQVHHDPALPLREVAQVLGLENVAFSEPVHAADVLLCEKSGCAGSADGLVTTTEGLALIGQSDGGPIVLIADSHRRAVGLAQASWRATVAGIVPAVVRRMVDLGCDPTHLVACICPSAGPCCFEVGEEVRTLALQRIGPHAMPFFRLAERRRQAPAPPVATCEVPRLRFDLWRANACALARAGLGAQSIHVAAICPVCRDDLFPRGRRRGDSAGRLAAGIGWASPASAEHTKEKASERSKPRKGGMLRDS